MSELFTHFDEEQQWRSGTLSLVLKMSPLSCHQGAEKPLNSSIWQHLLCPGSTQHTGGGCATSCTYPALSTKIYNDRFCLCLALAIRCLRDWQTTLHTLPQFSNRCGLGCRWLQQKIEEFRNQGRTCWAPHDVTELWAEHWWQNWSPSSLGAIRATPFCSLPYAVRNMVHPWLLKSRMCQAVSLQPCTIQACVFPSLWVLLGCEDRSPCKSQWTKKSFIHFANSYVKTSYTMSPCWEREMREGVRFRGACMVANLLHMEEMAFPCKMCFFSTCVSPVLMMMMNLSTFPLSSNPPARLRLFLSLAPGQRNS